MTGKSIKKVFLLVSFIFFYQFASQNLSARDFYWENSLKLTSTDSRFPSTVYNDKVSAVFWQETDSVEKKIYLSSQVYQGNNSWKNIDRFAGPFYYSGEIPDLYSAVIQDSGRIAIAALSDVNTISVYLSDDGGYSYSSLSLPKQAQPLLAPRIYSMSDNSFIIFTALGQNESFSMLYSKSSDGKNWSAFERFAPSENYSNPFIPVLVKIPGGDMVVFQAQHSANLRLSYQLYSTVSKDGGKTWTQPEMVTGAQSLKSDSSGQFFNYNNQRPSLYVYDNKVFMAWERTYYTSDNSHIWVQSLDFSGMPSGNLQELSLSGTANRPLFFEFEKALSLVWFDTRNGSEAVFFSQKKGVLWDEISLSSGRDKNVFAFPVITDKKSTLSFIWQVTPDNKKVSPYISRLSPDRTVSMPLLAGVDFKNGERGKTEKHQVRIRFPQDSSGIAGFSWLWTQNKADNPPARIMSLPSQNIVDVRATEEESWYFKVRSVDYAGNWSEPAEISFYKDTTPPKPPVFLTLKKDLQGFSFSNDLNITWEKNPSDDDIAGFSWTLQKIEDVERSYAGYGKHPRKKSDSDTAAYLDLLVEKNKEIRLRKPSKKITGVNASASYKNVENALYAFSVCAFDTVGNVGEPSVIFAASNKFIPSTSISSIKSKTSILGENVISILGRGFTYDGLIRKIYIDKDGKAPFDYEFSLKNNSYKISSDSLISNLNISTDVLEGKYCIGLLHSDRGLYFSAPILSVAQSGTVKIENEYIYEPEWIPVARKMLINVQFGLVLLYIICAFSIIGGIFAVRGIIQIAKETVVIRYEVKALFTGDIMALERKQKLKAVKKRSGSLRIKLMAFTTLLVLMIVILVSALLGTKMIRTQGQTLAEGLENRINVLLNSMSTGAKAYLPSQNVLELSYLPSQSEALSEAEYATITGLRGGVSAASTGAARGAGSASENLDMPVYIWATNDNDINSKIGGGTLSYGNSKVSDNDMQAIAAKCAELNETVEKSIGQISSQISELTMEGVSLALKNDSYSVARREEISTITSQLNSKLTGILEDISNEASSSFPVFDNTHLDPSNTEYLFYKPVLYRQGTEKNYVRGIVFLKVSTESLLDSVKAAARSIVISAILIAFAAVFAGALGAFVLATVIVRPIKVLEKYVSVIGSTKDKSKLVNKRIEFKSNDEIGNLRDAVNNMTNELVRAALEEQLSLDGRAVQQAFLPLVSNPSGGKATHAVLKDPALEAFGYYEGASGVSGDYFDYKKLDDRWYVFIKCDASGHGVPAALIMTVVATFFRRYFTEWNIKTKGTKINELISQINDFIESLGLRGKFAAIIVCLIDTKTGEVYMCNAGDNIVHIFDEKIKKVKTLTLPAAPAAGPMPSFMVDMKGGFKIEKHLIKKGDVLFLYTDGIEESTRICRDSEYYPLQKTEKDSEGNEKVKTENELLEADRILQIIEAVMNKGVFVLNKDRNPLSDEVLRFDFSSCTGNLEEVITALISVEKVFRMYKPKDVKEENTVRADKKIDAFLKEHFNLYDYYCASQNSEMEDANYVYYTNLMEDEQLDDLTLVAVRLP